MNTEAKKRLARIAKGTVTETERRRAAEYVINGVGGTRMAEIAKGNVPRDAQGRAHRMLMEQTGIDVLA